MGKLTLLASAAFVMASLSGVTAANAAYHIIGTEDNATGFYGDLFGGMFTNGPYLIGSDGEEYFDPFHAGYDTSDGLDFSGVGFTWYQAAGSVWTDLGNQTWVLPANTPCGNENEPSCEPVGHFWSPTPWVASAIGTWALLEQGGGLSDVLVTYNDANGAELLFSSDPSLIPEPSTWAMMTLGFVGLGFAGYRARKRTAALAA